ncbi:MAG: ATP-binding protein [Chitinophagaceae bacterium]|jgi:predicted AAA+ superfamily ATPase|nr:ATP-binding protein [Chitinophagaceae bacterium]
MQIERNIIAQLASWKTGNNRKPLILQGARQIGKTWAMQTFGERYFDHTAYFNFEKNEELYPLFENTKDPRRLIGQLTAYTSVPLEVQKTLFVFDEIQECNKALNSLKYFCEEAPEYAVVAAGSLLGVSMSKGDSFPVGKVDFLQMYPLVFKEFLAVDAPDLFAYCNKITGSEEIPLIIFNRIKESFVRYQITGGMPQAVSDFFDNKGMEIVENTLQAVLNAYSLDFAKHAEKKDIPKITAIWNSVPSQLSRENRKFLYKLVKPGARAREYEDALFWLQQAGLIYRIFANTKPHLPLTAYDDLSAFKIYLADIGLLRRLAKLPPEIIVNNNLIYTEFKGAAAENYVLQSLVTQFDVMPRYWTSEGKAEVDFLIQHNTTIIPVEVKSAHSIASKSLSMYNNTFKPDLRIRYSFNNLKQDGNLLNIPVFLADWTKKLIENKIRL